MLPEIWAPDGDRTDALRERLFVNALGVA